MLVAEYRLDDIPNLISLTEVVPRLYSLDSKSEAMATDVEILLSPHGDTELCVPGPAGAICID